MLLRRIYHLSRSVSAQQQCLCYQRRTFNTHNLRKLGCVQSCRKFSISSNRSDPESLDSTTKKPDDGETNSSKMSFLEARKLGLLKNRRNLSPFQRIAGLMKEQKVPTDDIRNELGEVTDRKQTDTAGHTEEVTSDATDDENVVKTIDTDTQRNHIHKEKSSFPLSHGEFVLAVGHLANKHNVRRMFKLNKVGTFECHLGVVQQSAIIGSHSGQVHMTNLGLPLVFRRASLEEYVLQMKRGPAILYPKDACTILTMADISPGDVVLEAGTGSGAMTLFLSKAVGYTGHVYSFDKRKDHQERAIINRNKWQRSWDISHPDKWPDNVSFHSMGLQDCGQIVQDDAIDAIILDVGGASYLMPILCRKLKPGKSIVVYIPQLTQTMDILDAIRTQQIPLMLESVLEVTHKSWMVKAANIDGMEATDEDISSNSIQYLCRPHHHQFPHTGFLMQLRKYVPSK